jgi:antitoxin component YwqK of YwqJK toxin-antitoxin module
MKKLITLLFVVFYFYKAPVQAQFLSGILINRYDRTNKHHGKWKYIDRANKRRLMCQGTFYHGRQVGEWKYYHPSGKLRMVEKYATKEERRLLK